MDGLATRMEMLDCAGNFRDSFYAGRNGGFLDKVHDWARDRNGELCVRGDVAGSSREKGG